MGLKPSTSAAQQNVILDYGRFVVRLGLDKLFAPEVLAARAQLDDTLAVAYGNWKRGRCSPGEFYQLHKAVLGLVVAGADIEALLGCALGSRSC